MESRGSRRLVGEVSTLVSAAKPQGSWHHLYQLALGHLLVVFLTPANLPFRSLEISSWHYPADETRALSDTFTQQGL